jgi:hypothetical protein
VEVSEGADGVVVRARTTDADARFLALWGEADGGRQLLEVGAAPQAEFALDARPAGLAVTVIDRAGNESPASR